MKTADINVEYIGHFGTDLNVVNAARVSFYKESDWDDEVDWGGTDEFGDYYTPRLKEMDAKLIRYLAKHKHFSPFNHSFISVRVKAPIFVARQLVKHKFMPWNEVSRRYVDEEPEFFFPELREKAENVKQGSGEKIITDRQIYSSETGYMPLSIVTEISVEDSLNTYKRLLKAEVCPEQARMVLPQNTMTEWVWSGTLGAFADMLKLRLDPHTQYETRLVAEKVKAIVEPLFPVSVGALLENK